ncbi:MAG: glycosyltransferase family 2 protein [candidate division Zixibacteria bacterium]|nr:glycosyltransferase family 2 protein [Candidatus Tariuqbacter arcticus]
MNQINHEDKAGKLHTVSVVIPTYNEEKYICQCLDSNITSDYPKDKLEILVVDGMSTDRTREIVKQFSQDYPYIRLIDNPNRFTPFAFNLGIRNSQKDIVIIMGAHADYAPDYISKCVYYLNEYKADNVGGVLKTVSRDNTLIGKAIAISLSHPFGVGNSKFRTGSKEPRLVDTVFGGCYRADVFYRIGLFNENLIRTQDMEFNHRLSQAGGRILLMPKIVTKYYPHSDLISFIKHNFSDGQWSILPFKYSSNPVRFRHLLPFIFVSGLILGPVFSLIHKYLFWLYAVVLILYLSLNIYFSFQVALKQKDLRLFFPLLIVFPSRHISYGLGSLIGFMKLLFSWKKEK